MRCSPRGAVRGALLLVAAILLVVPGVAGAAPVPSDRYLPPRPQGVPPAQWAELFGPTADGWSPQGTIVADSGFAPWRDTFGFFNYGTTLAPNNWMGYANSEPVDLTPAQVYRMFGPKACARVVRGRCTLTPAAEVWMATTNQGMGGGHCFGLAALSASFFQGTIPRSGFSTSRTNAGVRLTPAMQSELAYWWATQTTLTPAQQDAAGGTAVEIVQRLRQNLRDGKLPYVLIMFFSEGDGQTGGHAITPYAVYDRGAGKFDIAVYDNNYPLRPRAVHVDTVSNTWEYLVMTQPGVGQILAQGNATSDNLGLVPVSALGGRKACPFCVGGAGRSATQVLVNPVTGTVPRGTTARIVGADGKPLPGVVERKPLSPPSPDETLLPSFEVPRGRAFTVVVDATAAKEASVLDVSAFVPGGSVSAGPAAVAAGATLRVTVDPTTRSASVRTAARAETLLDVAVDRAGDDYHVIVGDLETTAGDTVSIRNDPRRGIATVSPSRQRVTSAEVAVVRTSTRGGRQALESAPIRIRSSERLVVNYGVWRGVRNPQVHIRRASGALVRVPLRVANG